MITLNVVSQRNYRVIIDDEEIAKAFSGDKTIFDAYSEVYEDVFDWNDLAESQIRCHENAPDDELNSSYLRIEEDYSEVYVENEEDGWIEEEE